MIDVTCPNPECQRVYHAEQSHVGKMIRCTNPKCNSLIPIVDGTAARIVQQELRTPDTTRRAPKTQSSARSFLYFAAVATLVIGLAATLLVYSKRSQIDRPSPVAAAVKPNQTERYSVDDIKIDSEHPDINASSGVLPSGVVLPKTVRKGAGVGTSRDPKERTEEDATTLELPTLPNGARLAPDIGVGGHGELTVNNGTSEDAEIILYDTLNDLKVRDVNVGAKDLLHIAGIPPGDYELKYAQNDSFYQFEKDLDYTEEERSGGRIEYNEFRITIHPVIGGNVRTKRISRSEFLKGHSIRKTANANTP